MKSRRESVSRSQVTEGKAWVYTPLENDGEIEWKELNAAACRIMQNYCGEYKNEELLSLGLMWLKDIGENEYKRISVDTPHRLMRTLEAFNIITCDEIILHASMARKASSKILGFFRLDYPAVDPPEWNKWVTVKVEDGGVKSGEMTHDFWKPLAENYEKHR